MSINWAMVVGMLVKDLKRVKSANTIECDYIVRRMINLEDMHSSLDLSGMDFMLKSASLTQVGQALFLIRLKLFSS